MTVGVKDADSTRRVYIRPRARWGRPDFSELYASRELLFFLAWRDIQVRYKQTVLGASWAIIQPLFTTVVFTVVFGRLADVPSDDVPYYMFSIAATVPWTFFSTAFTQASDSVVGGADLITKVYFPRLLVPLASVLSVLVDFAIAVALLFIILTLGGSPPGLRALTLPLFALLALITALATGTFLAALNAQFRDVKHAVPFLAQLWLFVSPVAYPSSLMPEPWRTLSGLNPMAGVIEGFRWALLDVETSPGTLIGLSAAVAVIGLGLAVAYFERVQSRFADIV